LIVHISRLPGGRRVVTQVSEVTRVDPEEKRVVVLDIFNFRNGRTLQPTGYLPSFVDVLVNKDLLDLEFLFEQGRDASAAVLPLPPVPKLKAT
jgi:pilus assembly protein CpaF